MKQFKHIITSGCSFSDIKNNISWPLHLSSSYADSSTNHTGLTSQGNGLIARKAMYAVQSALAAGIPAEEILVGIMWSGPDRHDMFLQHLPDQLSDEVKEKDFMVVNPTNFVVAPGGWLIMNSHWNEIHSKRYYTYFHDEINQRINTYEKILWTQLYLKAHNINYFMTAYTDQVLDRHGNNPNISWLKDQVDWDQWLPVKSMHSWCYNYWTDDAFADIEVLNPENGKTFLFKDNHPTRDMHVKFTQEVILSFINNKFPNYVPPVFKEFGP